MSRQSQHPLRALDLRPRILAGLLTGLSLFLLSAPPLHAGWSNGNYTDVFVSNVEVDELAVASDGNGGTLAMILDPTTFPYRARYSRINRAGTELWGDGGITAPFDINTQNQYRPVAIEADGSGGAFVVYQEWYSVSGVFHLVRLDATGVQLWAVDVATAASEPGQAGVRLVLEPGIGITIGYAESSSKRLYATRYDFDGNLLWSTDVNLFYHHNIGLGAGGGATDFDMQPDGQGGVLFAWIRYDLAAYQSTGIHSEQIGAQRIDSLGNRLWGSDGHQVWQQPGFWHIHAYGARVVADNAGGAYVVTSGGSSAYGQHLDSAGNETWATNGIVLQNTGVSWDTNTYPRICPDTVGGFYLVQQRANIFATRIDINGTPLWGTAGIIVSQSVGIQEYMDSADIDADGFGGAVIGYHDWNNGTGSVGGARIDAFGNVLWNDKTLFTASGNDRVEDVHVVADGIGGAQYVWKRHVWDAPRKHDVYALGVNAQGLAPDPVLFGILPDAGEPGDVLPTLVLGDYIDDSMDFSIQQGSTSFPITAPLSLAPNLVGGWLDLTGAPLGAWNLVADPGLGTSTVLVDAFGVGYRPACVAEWDAMRNASVELFGSFRKMDFDSQGSASFAWILPSTSPTEQLLYMGDRRDLGAGSGLVERIPGLTISDFSFTVDNDDRDVVCYVRNGNELVMHTYDWFGPGRVSALDIDTPYSVPLRRPVLCTTLDGVVRAVVELDNSGVSELWMAFNDGNGVTTHPIPNTGTNAHDADLAQTSDGMVMTFVRDTWLPGVSEVCIQHYRYGSWEAPTPLTFGLSITSPSVACDRSGKVLGSWILDNSGNGSAPTLQTQLIANGVPGDIRTRATDGPIYRVEVDAQGPDRFFLLTQETGQPMQIFVRGGDGHVFYPKTRINTDDDVDWPSFAVQYNGLRLGAMWKAFNNPQYGDALFSWFCDAAVMTGSPGEAPAATTSSLMATPNPFNPRTQLRFDLSKQQWVKVKVFDSRGRLVRTLNDGTLSAGPVALDFDGRDDAGARLASGVYFAQVRPSLDAPGVVKLTLLK